MRYGAGSSLPIAVSSISRCCPLPATSRRAASTAACCPDDKRSNRLWPTTSLSISPPPSRLAAAMYPSGVRIRTWPSMVASTPRNTSASPSSPENAARAPSESSRAMPRQDTGQALLAPWRSARAPGYPQAVGICAKLPGSALAIHHPAQLRRRLAAWHVEHVEALRPLFEPARGRPSFCGQVLLLIVVH